MKKVCLTRPKIQKYCGGFVQNTGFETGFLLESKSLSVETNKYLLHTSSRIFWVCRGFGPRCFFNTGSEEFENLKGWKVEWMSTKYLKIKESKVTSKNPFINFSRHNKSLLFNPKSAKNEAEKKFVWKLPTEFGIVRILKNVFAFSLSFPIVSWKILNKTFPL